MIPPTPQNTKVPVLTGAHFNTTQAIIRIVSGIFAPDTEDDRTPEQMLNCSVIAQAIALEVEDHERKHAAALEAQNAQLRELVKAWKLAAQLYRKAYEPDGHAKPHDCFATGPNTGDTIEDYVVCPACRANHFFDLAALTTQPQPVAGQKESIGDGEVVMT